MPVVLDGVDDMPLLWPHVYVNYRHGPGTALDSSFPPISQTMMRSWRFYLYNLSLPAALSFLCHHCPHEYLSHLLHQHSLLAAILFPFQCVLYTIDRSIVQNCKFEEVTILVC